jgi:Domain of unknown function DUF29
MPPDSPEAETKLVPDQAGTSAAYIDRAYRRARVEASAETGLDRRRFPEQCSYEWDDITLRDFAE